MYLQGRKQKMIFEEGANVRGGARQGLKGLGPKMSLSPPPTAKHTGQESGIELCGIL